MHNYMDVTIMKLPKTRADLYHIKAVFYPAVISSLSLFAIADVHATPDGGSLTVESQSLPQPEAEANQEIPLAPATPVLQEEEEGAVKVLIKGISFEGVYSINIAILEDALSDAIGDKHSFAGLNNLAAQVQGVYQEEGYLMAQAYLPEQSLKDGSLQINVEEGLLAEVTILSEGRLKPSVASRYSESLKGKALHSVRLERKLRLLTDLPGNDVKIVFSPSQQEGYADMSLTTLDTPLYSGYVGLDNHGNRFVGGTRVSGSLNINNALGYGELINATAASSGDGYQYVALASSVPLGADGLIFRGLLAATHYELGEQFSPLDADGDNTTLALGVTYPIYRSLNKNLYTTLDVKKQSFDDDVGATNTAEDKDISSLNIGLKGDYTSLSGSSTEWSVNVIVGDVSLDALSLVNDAYAREGSFTKLNGHISYNAWLNEKWYLSVKVNGQAAGSNLDSAEKMQLGGVNGVRAYPSGEALVDNGVIGTLELGYQLTDNVIVAGFVDAAIGEQHKSPLVTDLNNTKQLSGVGAKVDWQLSDSVVFSSSIAWRTDSAPTSDERDLEPRFWLQLVKHF